MKGKNLSNDYLEKIIVDNMDYEYIDQ